jgi:septal ring-binding cell division protein DamX
VSAVQTPDPAPTKPAPEERRCPRCGSSLTPEQEWCLNCGSEVGMTIAPPPSWRGPVLLVGTLLAIAVIALVLALVELADDAEQVAPAAATPVPTAAAVTPTPTPQSTTIPPAAATPTIAEWPAGTTAWTIVLESSATREAADARAEELAGQGISVGVLDSNDFSSLEPDRFVVFSGQYDSRRAADQARQDLSGQVAGAYTRRVVPESPSGGATPTPTPSPAP